MTEKPTVEMPHAPLKDDETEERVKLAQKRTQASTSDETARDSSGGRITRQHDGDATSYSNYLFGAAGSADAPLWSDTFKGRATIRFFSRFLVGSLAMTAIDRSMRGKLFDYDPSTFLSSTNKNFYTRIAYGFDKTFGTAIKGAVKLAGGTEKQINNSVRFRYKTYHRSVIGEEVGRSLGAEMTAVTASFGAGSLGDAATRNIIQAIDPNGMKVWRVNDKGEVAKPGEKSHFDFDKWLGATTRTTWRVLSKNMGEDWAVALPYVYQMRWQRNMLAHRWPDSKLTLDPQYQGASMYLNQNGSLRGNFEIPGALDLQMRFVGYNWYTLMYREAYDAVGRQFSKWADSGFSLKPHLPKDPIDSTLNAAGYSMRYALKSFIKANMYMQPAVPFFWGPRVAAARWRAAPIMQGQMAHENAIGSQMNHNDVVSGLASGPMLPDPVQQKMFARAADGGYQHRYNTTANMFMQDPGVQLRENYRQTDTVHFGSRGRVDLKGNPVGELMSKPGGMYSAEYLKQLWKVDKPGAIFSAAITPFGWLSYHTGSVATKALNHLPQANMVMAWLSRPIGPGAVPGRGSRERFTREYFDNAFAYTPYMIAKAETALRVDERPADGGLGEMDKAIYKFIDSTARFDLSNAGGAIKDMWHHGTNMNRAVKMREGGEVDIVPAKSVLTPEDRPANKVHTQTVMRHDPVQVDKQHEGEHHDEKSWAESVTGRELAGRFQHGPQSIH